MQRKPIYAKKEKEEFKTSTHIVVSTKRREMFKYKGNELMIWSIIQPSVIQDFNRNVCEKEDLMQTTAMPCTEKKFFIPQLRFPG